MGHSSVQVTEKYYVQYTSQTFQRIKKTVQDSFNDAKEDQYSIIIRKLDENLIMMRKYELLEQELKEHKKTIKLL